MRRREFIIGISMLIGPACAAVFGRGYLPTWPVADARQVLPASDLLAYWDCRPWVAGAEASVVPGSGTLRGTGSASPPTVTMVGPLVPRDVEIRYPDLGGALGTAKYAIYLGDSTIYGTTPTDGSVVDIGQGNGIIFGAGTYVKTTASGGHTHSLVCDTWNVLNGLANGALTSTLSGNGSRIERYGINGVNPSLYFLNNALCNETGVPALATGTDTQFEVHITFELWQQISGTGAAVPWGFCNQTDNTKSFIYGVATGSGNANASRYLINKKDSSVSPAATSTLICNNFKVNFTPHTHRFIVSNAAQVFFDGGFPGASATANLNRGVATNTNRFCVGGINFGTAGFQTANWCSMRMTNLAITRILTDQKALELDMALAS